MKNFRLLNKVAAVTGAFLFAASPLCAAPTEGGTETPLLREGFETAAAHQLPAGWVFTSNAGYQMQIAQSDAADEGTHVLEISAPTETPKKGFVFGAVILSDAGISFQPNQRYRLSVRVRCGAKTAATGNVRILLQTAKVSAKDAPPAIVGQAALAISALQNDWTTLSTDIIVPDAKAVGQEMRIQMQADGLTPSQSSVQFDRVTLEQIMDKPAQATLAQQTPKVAPVDDGNISPAQETGAYQGFGYPWENNNLGITNEVPAPWTKIVYRNNRLSLWGRDYALGKGVLPQQITSQKQDIFTRAPEMALTIDDKPVALEQTPQSAPAPAPVLAQGRSATFVRSLSRADYDVKVASSLEYDGLLKVELSITPRREITLNELKIALPLRREVARYFSSYVDYDFVREVLDRESLLSSYGSLDKARTMKWNPTVWVGNRHVGVEWVCETDEGWSNNEPDKAIEFAPAGAAETLMSLNVVTKPLKISKPYTLTFALYPTPIKPLPKNWQQMHLGHTDRFSPLLLEDARKLDINGISWALPVKYNGLPVVEASQAIKSEALPEQFRINDPEGKISQIRESMTHEGVHFVPYGLLWGLPGKLPDDAWKDYHRFWNTGNDKGGAIDWWNRLLGLPENSQSLIQVDIAPKSFQDFLVWQYVEAIKKYDIDGLYFDYGGPNRMSKNPLHAGGEYVAQGGQYYPFFAQRRLMERLYIACKAAKPDFLISLHNSKNPAISSGFLDLELSGEALSVLFHGPNWKPTTTSLDPENYIPDYSILPEELFSAQYANQYGSHNMLLPMVMKWNETLMAQRPDLYEKYSRTLMARTSVYNVALYDSRVYQPLLDALYAAQKNFGWLRDSQFYAPEDSDQFLKNKPQKLRVGMHLSQDARGVMLVAANLSATDAQETVQLDVAALKRAGVKLKDNARFVDAATSEPFAGDAGKGAVNLKIPANDYRILIVR